MLCHDGFTTEITEDTEKKNTGKPAFSVLSVVSVVNLLILLPMGDLKSAKLIYLKGILLDFREGLKGKGFVFTNPNASSTCGCGESFSV